VNPVTTKELRERCRRWVLADPVSEAVDSQIQDAIARAELQIRRIDDVPLEWLRGEYAPLRTRTYAAIDDISQADPGVVEATSLDSAITGHGFTDDDIVYISGLAADAMDELNYRFYRFQYINATTGSLKYLDDSDDIDTSGLDAYDSGGIMCHAGIKLPAIAPTTGDAWTRWVVKDIVGVTFDGYPAGPITESEIEHNSGYWCKESSSRPSRWRYWRHDVASFTAASREHYLLFYPPCANAHSIRLWYEKSYPQIDTFTASVYPPHPPEIHDFIWVRALSILSTEFEKQRRQSKSGNVISTQVEVINAQHWLRQAALDEVKIRELNRTRLGARPTRRGLSA
jgi:hypothetical protein